MTATFSCSCVGPSAPLAADASVILKFSRFNHVNHTVPQFLDRVPKVAQAGFLIPAATVQLGVFVDEAGVGDLQLTVFLLEARALGMLRDVRFTEAL
ncbi:hypothetical protein ABHI18_006156, partial [Aspergillus niger]